MSSKRNSIETVVRALTDGIKDDPELFLNQTMSEIVKFEHWWNSCNEEKQEDVQQVLMALYVTLTMSVQILPKGMHSIMGLLLMMGKNQKALSKIEDNSPRLGSLIKNMLSDNYTLNCKLEEKAFD